MNDTLQTLGQKAARTVKKAAIWSVVLAVLGCAVWFWGSLKYVFSTGERAGYVQKFSRKGWIFKTWEGELAMVSLPGAMPEIFNFTVRDEAAAKETQSLLGQRVILTYEEHKGLPGNIFGETPYFVTQSKIVDAPPAPKAP